MLLPSYWNILMKTKQLELSRENLLRAVIAERKGGRIVVVVKKSKYTERSYVVINRSA